MSHLINKGVSSGKLYFAFVCVLTAMLLSGCATLPQPKTKHGQTVTESSAVENVSVVVSYQGGVFYQLRINNRLPGAIQLMWDESTYVTTTGESVQILHLSDGEIPEFAPAQQDASLIQPFSNFQARFTGDDWLECGRRNCKPQPKDSQGNAKIYLAFKIDGKVVKWQADIAFESPEQP